MSTRRRNQRPSVGRQSDDDELLDDVLVLELFDVLELSVFDVDAEPDDEPLSLDDELLSPLDELLSPLDELVSFESFAPDGAVEAADFLPRLSVLKKPDPLNVTPTGVKTFFTGSTSPLSGWAISVRFSSWNPCWTSMVSPESTNL